MQDLMILRESNPYAGQKQLKQLKWLLEVHFKEGDAEVNFGITSSLERMHLIGYLLEVSIATLEHKYHIKNDGSSNLNVVTTLELAHQLLPVHESEFMDELKSLLQEMIG